jgi:hypothetical protein
MAEKRGRPPKPPAEKKGAHATVRLTAPLYEELAEAARAGNRTISQEIEARLRLSFAQHQKTTDEFGGPTNYWLLRIIAHEIGTVEQLAHAGPEPRRWWEDPYTFRQVKILINTFFDFFKPAGRAVTPRLHAGIGAPLGARLAEREMANIETASMAGAPLDGYPHGTSGLPAGTLISPWPRAAEWFAAAGPIVTKLKKSPLEKLYGIKRTRK